MTYPTDYGSLAGYTGEDEADLDFFKGTGDQHGSFQVWRPDVKGELETKFYHGLTPQERDSVLAAFQKVVRGTPASYADEPALQTAVERFANKPAAADVIGDLSGLLTGDNDFVLQEHGARKAGRHFDVRLGNRKQGLLSWVSRHPLPVPGGQIYVKQMPVHKYSYKDFEGVIPAGRRGAGWVRKVTGGKANVLEASRQGAKFVIGGQKYALLRPKDWAPENWLLVNLGQEEKKDGET